MTDNDGKIYPLRWVHISGQNGHVNIYYSIFTMHYVNSYNQNVYSVIANCFKLIIKLNWTLKKPILPVVSRGQQTKSGKRKRQTNLDKKFKCADVLQKWVFERGAKGCNFEA